MLSAALWSIQTKTTFGLAVGALALIAVAVASQRSTTSLVATAKWVAQSHGVLEHLAATQGALNSAESALRAYVITGNEVDRGEFAAGEQHVLAKIAGLRELTHDDPRQRARCNTVAELATKHLAALRAAADTRQRFGFDAAVAQMRGSPGPDLMDDVTAELASMAAAEQARLDTRARAAEAGAQRTTIAILSATGLALAVGVVAAILVRREMRARDGTQAELRAILDNSPVVIAVRDFAGRFVVFNQQAERTLRMRAAEVIGRTIEQLRPDLAEVWRAHDQRVLDSGVPLTVEEEVPQADGVHVYLSTRFLLRGINGVPDGICTIANDVTERRAMTDLLHQRAREIEDLYDLAPCGYHSLDVNGVFKRINRTALSWLDYDREELVGQRNFADVLTPESAARFADAFARFKVSGSVRNIEFDLLRKDGTTLPVALSATAVRDGDGSFLYSRTTYFDISDRRQMEAALRQRTADAEAATKDLEAFSYSVSHDLRAPLRHLDGFIALLRKREGARLDATSARYVDVISAASAKMGQLIDDLLDFSRTGRAELREQRVPMTELVEDLQRELVPLTKDRQISIEIGPLPAVQADPSLLRVVFTNLLSNAIKYTTPRALARIEVGVLPPLNGEVVTYVRDNGVGFDPQYAHKLFGVFQRLHRDEEFEGTGVGLATVRRIVERHGGRVWAEGQLDAGATVYFSLKRA
ncbi:MAG: PAS domain S-box protein [Candidatus Binatia bacterium]